MKHEHNHTNGSFSNSLGFILACVGSAVGLGNIWMFPYRLGQYGGAAFLLLVDDLARTLAATEIPIGILTAFVGAPFFIYLMVKGGDRL